MKKAQNILDFLSIADMFNKISTLVRCSPGELVLMILKFCNTYMLPLSTLNNMISLVNSIFEHSILPESRYLIDKLFNFQNKAQYHIISPTCSQYLGQKKESDKDVYCNMCDSSISVSNMSPSNCFVLLDPSTEI